MFPNKAKMARNANLLRLILAAAPALYLVIAALVTLQGGFASDQTFVLVLFFGLVFVSAANIGLTIFLQARKTLMEVGATPDPVGRTFLTMATGSILSETHAIYGLVLTLLSGSIFYGIGFTIVTWASLWWVWKRFKQSLASLPNE